MILGTAGHIDHGKTALVRALTGIDTDRLPEEKRRGITIDLGFAPLEIDGGGTIAIVDVPGHEAFIRTMLAGASGIDLALVVIAADEGIMPQTEEHLEILGILGVSIGIVAVTKCDLVDNEWLALQIEEIKTHLSASGRKSWDIIPVSAKAGRGINELRDAIAVLSRSVPQRDSHDDFFRMPIDRAFTVTGTGSVVTGTVWSGSVTRDSTVVVQPSGKAARVRGIEHHSRAATVASAGERTAIALAGVDLAELERGSVLVSSPSWNATREIVASVKLNRDDIQITARTRVLFHLGTTEVEARLRFERVQDDDDNEFSIARVHFSRPLVARSGDRFVLRMPSPARTIGGGIVADPFPPARQRGKRSAIANRANSEDSLLASLARLLEQAGTSGLQTSSLSLRTVLTGRELRDSLHQLQSIDVGAMVYSRDAGLDVMRQIESKVLEGVANHPLEAGVSLQATRSAVRASDDLIAWAMNELIENRRIEISQSLVRPAGWTSSLGNAEQGVSDAIMHEICKQPAEPPSMTELESRFGGKTRQLVKRLEREGRLERVSDDRYYSSEAVVQIVNTMRAGLKPGRTYTPAELKEVLGVSRKYLIPFLEFCDRIGVTERRREGRALRPMASAGS